jgi:hypothetical protein
VTPVEPIGPVEVRPKPVERTSPVERTHRPAQRDPERDARERERERERRRRDDQAPADGHIDIRA